MEVIPREELKGTKSNLHEFIKYVQFIQFRNRLYNKPSKPLTVWSLIVKAIDTN